MTKSKALKLAKNLESLENFSSEIVDRLRATIVKLEREQLPQNIRKLVNNIETKVDKVKTYEISR